MGKIDLQRSGDEKVTFYSPGIYIYIHDFLDLPRGAEWMIRGAYLPSLRVQTVPFGSCWLVLYDWLCCSSWATAY